MLDINLLRNDIDMVVNQLKNKKIVFASENFNQLETQRKDLQIKLEALQAKRNSYSKEIGSLKSQRDQQADSENQIAAIMAKIADINAELKTVDNQFSIIQQQLTHCLAQLPNLTHASVPIGANETANQEIRKVGKIRTFNFTIQDHVDLGFNLQRGIDFAAASKMSGSRFVVLRDKIAKLHRMLAQFMLDIHSKEHGYNEVYIPYLVNSNAVYGTGQLPKFADDLFKINHNEDELYLIPTAEVSLTNLIADTLLKHDELPLKFVAHSPCFRSEAGSYGKDTRGMIRMHQFDKVELVQVVTPDVSYQVLEELTSHAERILQLLELPYRVMLLCTGDTGFSSAKTYDLEVWLPSQDTYREISSCSNMTDFQARRLNARYKNIQGKNELVHTLNGSGLAVGRTLVAILENYQNQDGSITVPEVLRPYMGCNLIK